MREINMHRNRSRNFECHTEIPRKCNGTTHEYNRGMPRKSKVYAYEYTREGKGFTYEYNREIPRTSNGTTHEYRGGIPRNNSAVIFKQAQQDGEEVQDGYNRERPRKLNGTIENKVEQYGEEIRNGYNRERPRKINGTIEKKFELDGKEIRDGYSRERPRKINGTVLMKVEVDGREIKVTVTCESKIVDGWIEKNGGLMLGMDLEWRPNFRGGEENKAALLQLCGNFNSCLVVQLLYLDSMPTSLVGILGDFEVKIAGVGIEKDAEKLYKDYGVKCRGLVDLPYLASVIHKRTDYLFWGLKRLADEVLGVSIGKYKREKLSDWSRRELKPSQIEYACIDAYVSFRIAAKLIQRGWPSEMNLEEFTQASFK